MRLPRHIERLIRSSPDPDWGKSAIDRLATEIGGLPADFLDPERSNAADRVVRLLSVSHAALRYLLADPPALDALLAVEGPLDESNLAVPQELTDSADRADREEFRASLLKFRRRAWMQIVAADLAGEVSLYRSTKLFSDVAAACIAASWIQLAPRLPVGVIALGKLGGYELNYSSDVDLVFVCPDSASVNDSESAVKSFISFLGGDVASERILLVDPDLRPEGRSGPLVRSLSSYEKYWRNWAEPWEIQALIKARPVYGPEEITKEFEERSSAFLWPETIDPESIKAIRQIKRRTEAHTARTSPSFDIKRSSGGIRDVEMAVQLLQLIHGRHDISLRSSNTLDAVDSLEDGDYISSEDAQLLRDSYVFLRNIEHRLQIRNDSARYDLPQERADRRILAKSLGFGDTKAASAEDSFDDEFTRVTAEVRQLHRRLFFRPLLEVFAAMPKTSAKESPAAVGIPEDVAEERLAALGFRDTRQARVGLEELTRGISRRSRLMGQLMPLVLEWLSEAPDPATGLTNLRKLVEAVGDQVMLVSTFRENPAAVQRLCKVLGTSRVLSELLIRNPDAIHAFADDQELFSTKTSASLVEEAQTFTSWRSIYEEKLDGILRFCNRELLRTATRDLLSNDRSEVELVAEELCGISQGAVSIALDAAIDDLDDAELRFCVVGLGSFGAGEMAYSSDIDVMFLYDAPGDSQSRESRQIAEKAHRLATRLLHDLRGLGAPGLGLNLDADLRPEGRSGVLARSLVSAITYYEKWADTWEYQALTKARPVAGDFSLFERLMETTESLIWPTPFPHSRIREIRLMKARVEKERVPGEEARRFHLKLGPGGLVDVQFIVELYSLKYGGANPELRFGSTLERLRKLTKLGLIPEEDAMRLEDSYLFCSHVRNRMFLIKGHQQDTIPQRPEEAVVLAESLGYLGHPRSHLIEDFRRMTRRARSSFEKLFYSNE
jgi:glutamate-ammonia-ligase adenylyltransferase